MTLEQSLGLKSKISIRKLATTTQYAVLKLSQSALDQAKLTLGNDARVAYAEPNFIYHSFENPNDAEFNSLWGLKNSGQKDAAGQIGKPGSDIHVTSVWNEGITGNRKIKVAVIDTGIDYNHPDLKANVDAASGYNFVNNTANARDDQSHGSHCAGTIGGVANNGIGVTGVNWNVTLIPIKFLDSEGSGTTEGAIQSIQHATQLGVHIMSNSWGGGGYSQAMYDVIKDAKDQGILFVAAAGNNGTSNDSSPSYPASYALDNIVSVAASDNRDRLASFSNFGKSVHVAAPGVKIYSTTKDGTYGYMSGTSMAAPHVSGIAALLLSANPSLSYSQIKDLMIRSCDKVRSLSKKVKCGGRVNVENALHGVFPVSESPAESEWKDVETSSFESLHPYLNGKEIKFPISVSGAKKLRVTFESIDTEAGYDTVSVKQADGEEIENLSGTLNQYITDYLDGDHAEIVLRADSSVNNYGFKVSQIQAIY